MTVSIAIFDLYVISGLIFVNTVQTILILVYNLDNDDQSWEAIPPDTATFTPDISPLVLAAHTDNYEVIIIISSSIIVFMNNIGIR